MNKKARRLSEVQSGQRFDWVGIPGQHSMDGAQIEVHSMTAKCGINTSILRVDREPSGFTIGAADFAAALDAGWLVASA